MSSSASVMRPISQRTREASEMRLDTFEVAVRETTAAEDRWDKLIQFLLEVSEAQ